MGKESGLFQVKVAAVISVGGGEALTSSMFLGSVMVRVAGVVKTPVKSAEAVVQTSVLEAREESNSMMNESPDTWRSRFLIEPKTVERRSP